MELRLLGPMEVLDGGRPLPVARGRERALLALLAIHAGEPLGADRIVDELWEERPPGQAVKNVQVHVSRLRRTLGADRIETTGAGYLLRLGDGELDTARFEALVASGRARLERGDSEGAREALVDALTLWRGDALADF